jgi:26-hydroxylase
MDSKLWDEPKEFRPSRFLVDGKVQKPEFFIPFGVGRRMCLGTILAKIEVFVFFTSFMHRFDISLPEGAELPSLEGNPGVTYYPDKFDVCLKDRPMNTDPTDDNTPIRSYGR